MAREENWQSKRLIGMSRRKAIFVAENLIAEQRADDDIDATLMKQFNLSANVAATIRDEAFQALMGADTMERKDRFQLVLVSLRRLYAKAFDEKKLSVCANVLHQMREMFDLIRPAPEGKAKDASKHAGRPIEDLEYFVQHGVWPEDGQKEVLEPVTSDNPLDELG